MTTEATDTNDNLDNDNDNTDVNDNENSSDSLEALKAENAKLQAEATKQRKLKQKLSNELNELKKAPTSKSSDSDDANEVKYKSLYEQEKKRADDYLNNVRDTQIKNELTSRLTKSGIQSDMLDAGIRLTDREMIEWDEQGGVDGPSVDAAIHQLKSQYGGFFEKTVQPSSTKPPAKDSSSNQKVMTRKEYNALPIRDQAKAMKDGYTLTE